MRLTRFDEPDVVACGLVFDSESVVLFDSGLQTGRARPGSCYSVVFGFVLLGTIGCVIMLRRVSDRDQVW